MLFCAFIISCHPQPPRVRMNYTKKDREVKLSCCHFSFYTVKQQRYDKGIIVILKFREVNELLKIKPNELEFYYKGKQLKHVVFNYERERLKEKKYVIDFDQEIYIDIDTDDDDFYKNSLNSIVMRINWSFKCLGSTDYKLSEDFIIY